MKPVYKCAFTADFGWIFFPPFAFRACIVYLRWAEVPRASRGPIPPAALISLSRSLLKFLFSHVGSHTYRFVHFSSCQDWHLLLLRNTYQMRDVTGADEEKEEDESPIYHISIPSQWIIEKRSRLTRVARPRVCWLFFARPSLFAMLHNLFAPLPAWHQPVHLFVCLPPGSRPLLPPNSLHLSEASSAAAIRMSRRPAAQDRPGAPRAAFTPTQGRPGVSAQSLCNSDKAAAHVTVRTTDSSMRCTHKHEGRMVRR